MLGCSARRITCDGGGQEKEAVVEDVNLGHRSSSQPVFVCIRQHNRWKSLCLLHITNIQSPTVHNNFGDIFSSYLYLFSPLFCCYLCMSLSLIANLYLLYIYMYMKFFDFYCLLLLYNFLLPNLHHQEFICVCVCVFLFKQCFALGLF